MKCEKLGRNDKARTILKNETLAPPSASRRSGKPLQSAVKGKKRTRVGTKIAVRDEHRKLWGKLRRMFWRSIRKKDKEELKFVKIGADALLDITKGEWTAWGLTDEEFDECLDSAGSLAEEMERLTAPPGADAALDGGEEI